MSGLSKYHNATIRDKYTWRAQQVQRITIYIQIPLLWEAHHQGKFDMTDFVKFQAFPYFYFYGTIWHSKSMYMLNVGLVSYTWTIGAL